MILHKLAKLTIAVSLPLVFCSQAWGQALDEPPGPATSLAPMGEINGGSNGTANFPEIQWGAVSTATEYYVWVNPAGPEPTFQSPTLSAVAVCSNPVTGTCKWQPPGDMVDGRKYIYWVGTRNVHSPGGAWTWNASKDFTYKFLTAAVPDQIPPGGLYSPAGNYSGSDPTMFSWVNSSTASWYLIRVFIQDSGFLASAKWFTAAAAGCATPANALSTCDVMYSDWSGLSPNGDYKWTVQPWNSNGSPVPAQSTPQVWARTDQ